MEATKEENNKNNDLTNENEVQKEENVEAKEQKVKDEKKKSASKMNTLGLIALRFRWLIFGVVIGAVLCFMFYARIRKDMQNIHNVNSTTINIDYLTGRIRNMSDLITAELQYRGLVEHKTNEDKWNSFFTSDQFIMTYNAEVKAGIDLSLVKISEFMGKYKIMIPHATIKYNKVDPKSIKFYNVKSALIKGDDKRATQESIVEAEEDVLKNGNTQLLIDNAEQQAENLIAGLIKELIGDNEIVFEYFDVKQTDNNEKNEMELGNSNMNEVSKEYSD